MTGRQLYEKWCELAGDSPITSGWDGAQPKWHSLDFAEARAWDDLAAHLKEPGAAA